MTKNEAIELMDQGRKVTHRYFTSDEWMCKFGYLYKFEDDCLCSINDFWVLRDGDSWDDGWSEYE